MKKNVKIISIISLIILFFLLIIFTTINFLFFNMSRLPSGDFLSESTSPQKTYTIKSYICNSGATVDSSIRCELFINNSKKNYNIYWEYKSSNVTINWIDDNTVNINNHILTLPNEKYDWRKEKFKKKD